MNKQKDELIIFISKILETYKKYQNEILKQNKKNNIKFQNEYLESINNLEKYLNDNKEITNEIQNKILKLIIMTISTESSTNIIETSLEAIEILALNNYFSEEVININITNLTKNIMCIYNYKNNIKIIMQVINLIKILIGSKNFYLKNESLYDVIIFLIINILQVDNYNNNISIYQIQKSAKTVLNKCIDELISRSINNNNDNDLETIFNY